MKFEKTDIHMSKHILCKIKVQTSEEAKKDV
jgi:hypothetical protein